MVMKEIDDDLALFLQMREKQKNDLFLLQNPNDPLGSKHDSNSIFKTNSTLPSNKPRANDFLNSENEKTDYDWLLTPPPTPLFPSLDMESQKTIRSQVGTLNTHQTALISKPTNPHSEPASRTNITSRQPTSSTSINSVSVGKRPSPSGALKSTAPRSATPTGGPTLPATSKPSRNSTPTSRATFHSNKPTAAPVRSSTPISSSKTKSGVSATTSKKLVPSRGTSPIVKPRPWKPSEMPVFSHNAPPNLRTTMPERPISASRGRPSAPSARSSSTGRLRQKSCSPSKGRTANGSAQKGGSSVLVRSRGHRNGSDDVNPVLIGTQMVERVVNMRKLAPPNQDDQTNDLAGKLSSSQENSGFGRTLSKKSLDMAIRHMDIRRSITGNLRPLVTTIPTSSVCGVRSGSTKNRTASVSDSPLATSSNASSEPSVNHNSHCF